MVLKNQTPEMNNEERKVVGTSLSDNIKAKVKSDAKIHMRSLSAQIAWIVEQYYLGRQHYDEPEDIK